VKVSVISDNRRRLATQFERARNKVLGGRGGNNSTNVGRSNKEDVAPSFLQKIGGVANSTEADSVGLRVEVFGYELRKEERTSLRVLRGLSGEIEVSDPAAEGAGPEAYLDNERCSSRNCASHWAQDQEPRVVPGRDDQSDTFGLFLDPWVVHLETERSVPDAGLVLHPFGEALDCQFDFAHGVPDLVDEVSEGM
jgi:hypothetical protein